MGVGGILLSDQKLIWGQAPNLVIYLVSMDKIRYLWLKYYYIIGTILHFAQASMFIILCVISTNMQWSE